MINYCECECGGIASPGKRFIRGHHRRIPREIRTCRCGKTFECKITSKNRYCASGCWSLGLIRIKRELRYCKCDCGESFECKVTSKKRFVRGHNTKSRNIKGPTKPEIKLDNIIKKYSLPYKYTGDGKFWIKDKKRWINPDFVNTNHEKICLEMFGNYWHNLPRVIKSDAEKLKILQEYGWKRIVIWEDELKELSEKRIVEKIAIKKS